MGRVITRLVLFVSAVSGMIFFTGCGNTLLQEVEGKVAAAKGITVDFRYDGPFEISESMPVMMRFYPNPFTGEPETDPKIKDIRVSEQGKILIPDSKLTTVGSKKYFVVMFHDLNNNGVEDSIEDDLLFENNGDTNIMYDISNEYILERLDSPFYIELADKVLMGIGSAYPIRFIDENDYVDEWEPDDSYLSSTCDTLSSGVSNKSGHTLGWEDVDYIKLDISSTGTYTVTVESFESNNPVMDISIMDLQNGILTHVGSNYDVGSFPSSLIAYLTVSASDQYFLRIKNPRTGDHGIGNYTVSFSGS